MSDFKETPDDRLYKRVNQSRLKLWFLMGGNRWLVTGILVMIVFITLLISGYLYTAADGAIRNSDSVDTLFQALLTSIITGVTIVVSLNQLVLSQELGAVYDQRERMEGAMKFREDVADVINADVSPTRPAQFIRALVQVSSNRAKDFKEAVSAVDDKNFKEEVNAFTNSLIQNAKQVVDEIDTARFGEFEMLSSALDFNYSWKIFAAKKIKKKYNDLLNEKAEEEIEKLIDALYFFGPTREHFKTLYFQSELIDLSKRILFAAIPALLVSSFMIIFFNVESFNITVFNIENLVMVMR